MTEMGLPVLTENEINIPKTEEKPVVEEESLEVTPSSTGSSQPAFPAAGTLFEDQLRLYFPAGLEPCIDIYLGWRERYPEGYARLIR